jgi:PAS domain S-box-containing protein
MNTDIMHQSVARLITTTIACLTLTVVVVILFHEVSQTSLGFHFNGYALLPLATIISNTALLIYINRTPRRTMEGLWFSIYVTSLLIWALCEVLQRLSPAQSDALFWSRLAVLGWPIVPTAAFMFALAYTQKERFTQYASVIIIMVFGSLTLAYATLTSGLLVNYVHSQAAAWGFRPTYGPLYSLFILWFIGSMLAAIALLARYRHDVTSLEERHQTRIFILALLVPIIGGGLTDGVLPLFGIHLVLMAVPLSSVTALIVAYGISRYGLLRLNPHTFAPGILESMGEAVIVVNQRYEVQYLNHGATTLLGPDQHPAGSTSLHDYVSPNMFERIEQQTASLSQPGQIIQINDLEVLNTASQPIPVSLSLAKIADFDGRSIGYSLVMADMREIKAAEHHLRLEKASVERKVKERTHELSEAQAQLLASVHSLPFGFALVNPDNQIVFHNEQLQQLLNRPIPSDPAESRQVLEQVDADYKGTISLIDCIHEAQAKLQPVEQNIEFGPRFYRFFFMPILSRESQTKQAIGTVLTMEDTTEQKAQERSRDEFFSIASHELRTPLTAIRGNADMILDYYKEQIKDPSLHEMVEDVKASSLRLIAIVNDFLDMSRLEQSRLVFKNVPLDITELVNQVLHEYDVTGSRRKLSLELEPSTQPVPEVYADSDRTRQILINLIGNSLKFTSRGGVKVRLTTKDTMLYISVIDTGRGIPVESEHLLFRKFQQATDSILTRDDTKGTGLGLYISKLLARGMHGDLYLEQTAVDKGSTFTLALPLASKK